METVTDDDSDPDPVPVPAPTSSSVPSSTSSVGIHIYASPRSLPSPLSRSGVFPSSIPTPVPTLGASPRSVPTSVPTLGASPRSMPSDTLPRIHRKHVRLCRLRDRQNNELTKQRKRHRLYCLSRSLSPSPGD